VTIRVKLLATFVVVGVLLGTPTVYVIQQLLEVRGIAVALRTRHAEAFAALGTLRASLAEYDRHARSYVIAPDPRFRAELHAALARARQAAVRLGITGYHDPAYALTRRLDSLASTTLTLETLVETRRAAEATVHLRVGVQPVFGQIRELADPLGDAIGRASTEAATEAQTITASAVRTATFGALLALFLGAAVATWVTGALTAPLRRLRSSMASVAGGAFAAGELPYGRADEIGDLARSFRSMTERLAELDRMRGEFLNVVSHDLKAPLSLIRGCAELVEDESDGRLGTEQRRLLGSIREHVAVLTERVNKLLSLGRLEARAYPIAREDLPVAPVFETVRHAFEPQARHQGIAFEVTVESTAPAVVQADPDCLYHEVVGNLLANALKFTPRGGRVVLRVWGEPGALHLTVADTGPGIPADQLPWVFTRYYQVGRPAAGAGTGLGLAIARQVVEAHDGSIAVESTPPLGTTFHVTLPAAERAQRAQRPLPVTPPRTVAAGRWRVGTPRASPTEADR
jgi:signal transduction histidine kinase